MNKPLDPHVLRPDALGHLPAEAAELALPPDDIAQSSTRLYLSGIQALVHLPILQRLRDQAAGLNTAGFISGYRGSPLGVFDEALWKAKKLLDEHHVRFEPGINEDLGATMVWGTQQVNLFPRARYDGVFAMWYGKGPGVDRTMDVFKHANAAGTSPHGGVLAIAGDDHGSKSSTLPHQSEQMFAAAMMPVLNPSGVRDYLDLGIHSWALSRYSGCWVGLKATGDTVCKRQSNCVPPCRSRIRSHGLQPERHQIRIKLRPDLSFLVSKPVAYGRRTGTRFLCPGGTQLLCRLEPARPTAAPGLRCTGTLHRTRRARTG